MFKPFSLIIMAVFLITGCTKIQQNSNQQITYPSQQAHQKIGYLINVRPNPTHTHIGTTALTNFTKQYPFNWKIPSYIKNRLEREVGAYSNIKLINLAQYDVKPNEVNGLLKYLNGRWVVRKGKESAYRNLTNRLGLSTIIIINESAKQAIEDCGLFGCKEFKAEGYGLTTQGFINSTKFISATTLYVHIYKLKPLRSLDPKVAEINHSKKMTVVAIAEGSKVQPNKIGFTYPKNFNNWTKQEFKPFRLPLVKYIDGMAKKIADVIQAN